MDASLFEQTCFGISNYNLLFWRYLCQGSVESKLLSSVFYDLGKALAEKNQMSPDLKDDATNNYFLTAIDEFLLQFPIINYFARKSKHKILTKSCLAFLRMNARNGFWKVIKGRKI